MTLLAALHRLRDSLARWCAPRPHLLLLVGNDGTLAVPHYFLPPIPALFVPSRDKGGEAMIVNMAASQNNPRVTILSDTLEQDFSRETLPPLFILDRLRLLRRRTKQAFPNASLTGYASVHGSSRHSLIAALNEDHPALIWAERLAAYAPVIGLTPIEGAELAAKIDPSLHKGWALLISNQQSGGMRQIVLHDGHLVFTRLTPPLPAQLPDATCDQIIQRDIMASVTYLHRLGLNHPNDLSVLILRATSQSEAWPLTIKMPVKNVTFIDPREAAERLRIPLIPEQETPHGDLLFAGWVLKRSSLRLALSTQAAKRTRYEYTLNFWGLRAAYAVLLATLLTLAVQVTDIFTSGLEVQSISSRIAAIHHELQSAQTEAAPITEPLGRLRLTLERQRIYARVAATPWALFNDIANVIGGKAQVTRLHWQAEDKSGTSEHAQISVTFAATDPQNHSALNEAASTLEKTFSHQVPAYQILMTQAPYPASANEIMASSTSDNHDAPRFAEYSFDRRPP